MFYRVWKPIKIKKCGSIFLPHHYKQIEEREEIYAELINGYKWMNVSVRCHKNIA